MGYAEHIGRKVAEYRQVLGLSAQKLADESGLSRSVISNLENGRKSEVTVAELVALAHGLNVPPSLLLVDIKDPFSASATFEELGMSNAQMINWFGSDRFHETSIEWDPLSNERGVMNTIRLLEENRHRVHGLGNSYASLMSTLSESELRERIEREVHLYEVAQRLMINQLEQHGVKLPPHRYVTPSVDQILTDAKVGADLLSL